MVSYPMLFRAEERQCGRHGNASALRLGLRDRAKCIVGPVDALTFEDEDLDRICPMGM